MAKLRGVVESSKKKKKKKRRRKKNGKKKRQKWFGTVDALPWKNDRAEGLIGIDWLLHYCVCIVLYLEVSIIWYGLVKADMELDMAVERYVRYIDMSHTASHSTPFHRLCMYRILRKSIKYHRTDTKVIRPDVVGSVSPKETEPQEIQLRSNNP
ncbi:hypothetical protein I7I51_06676 [Histoplasma capsulatum]|uniref:Uncharacterized protein n=1 Tax=Ajellomyces capsulatus TaxID=5037 RepID=A0A8A1MIY0_AJECA|nr:hypothetical protein I7I51_06676 [Histoplasma capsulatum]